MASHRVIDGFPQLDDRNVTTGSIQVASATQTANLSARSGLTLYPRKDFGAVGDGVADDTAALQAWIDAAVGGPTTGPYPIAPRRPKAILEWEDGTYRITAPLKIWAVIGLTMQGCGYSAMIRADGIFASVLDICGAAFSTFNGFSITGKGDRSESITHAIYYYWDAAISSFPASGCAFGMIQINTLRFVNGIKIGKEDSGVQVDVSNFNDINIQGYYPQSLDVDHYKYGVYCGDGVFGNILANSFFGVGVTSCQYGARIDRTNAVYESFSFSDNVIDFHILAANYLKIGSGRCEGSTRILYSEGVSNQSNVEICDVLWTAPNLNADNKWIVWEGGGLLALRSVTVPYLLGKVPTISTTSYLETGIILDGVWTGCSLAQLTAECNSNTDINTIAHCDQLSNGSLTLTGLPDITAVVTAILNGQPTFGAGCIVNGTMYTGASSPIILGVGSYLGDSGGFSLVSASGSTATLGGLLNWYMPIKTNGFMQIVDHSYNPIVIYDEATKSASFYGYISSVSSIAPGNGSTVGAKQWSGSGVPSNGLGSDGDFYFRSDGTVAAHTVVYHKESGSWVPTGA